MKVSKLDYSLLTDEEKFQLVMNGITDLAEKNIDDKSKADLIIVLGCSPVPLEARIKKMMQLYRKGYSKSILLTGGDGWQKLYKKKDQITGETYIDEAKRRELLEAIRKTISANLLGDNPSEKELALYDRFNEGMNEMLLENEVKSYDKRQDDRLLKMDEAEFMKLMILSNGGLEGAKIFHEPFSYNTKENMLNTNTLIKSLITKGELEKLDRMIVVTSSFHCRRAMLTFKKQFPNVEIIPCPATCDLEKRGLKLGREMMSHPYYKQQIENECKAIINYSKNGSIEDVDLEEILPEEIAGSIIENQEKSKEVEK